MEDQLRQTLLETVEACLEAQLTAVRKLKTKSIQPERPRREKSKSNLSIVEDILASAGEPLHISEIMRRSQLTFGRQLNRESLGSALIKCVARKDRFIRTAPNTFGLLATDTKGS